MGAGELGWNHPFQIFREAFANALDAHYENGSEYSLDITSRVFEPVEGEFSVYLTADPSMINVVEEFDKYFSLNREDVIQSDMKGNKVLKKLDSEEGVRIYHKGVLVYGPELGGSSTTSLYDYDLHSVELNEERTLKDISTNEIYAIAQSIGGNMCYDTEVEALASDILKKKSYQSDGIWEWNYAHPWSLPAWMDIVAPKRNDSFGKTFTRLAEKEWCNSVYPDMAFTRADSTLYDEVASRLRERGYKVLGVNQAFYNLLSSTGAGDNLDKNILGDDWDADYVELSVEDKRFFDVAHNTLLSYDLNIINYPVKFMKTTSRNEHIMGKAAFGKNGEPDIIILNECVIKSRNIKQLLATMVHEMDHFLTRKEDNTREFRDAADERLGELLLKHYCDKSDLIEIMQEKARD
jgi:hypothetical protein